jgi:formiminoglutamase
VVDVEAARRGGALDTAFHAAFGGPGFVSIDLDALDGAWAPGVSAVNPDGLDVSTVGVLAERAGRTENVLQIDFMELSPPHDLDGRTARVAAHLFLRFLAGLMARPS